MREWIVDHGGAIETAEGVSSDEWHRGPALKSADAGPVLPKDLFPQFSGFPRYRRWFGDEPIFYISVGTKATAEEREQVAELFPEAIVRP